MNKVIYSAFLFVIIYMACQPTMKQGQRIYQGQCANCHMEDGSGLGKVIPSLTEVLPMTDDSSLICTIIFGINPDSIGFTPSAMPAHDHLTDAELANLINYLRQTFDSDGTSTLIVDPSTVRNTCH